MSLIATLLSVMGFEPRPVPMSEISTTREEESVGPRFQNGMRYAYDIKTRRPFLVDGDSKRVVYLQKNAIRAKHRAKRTAEAVDAAHASRAPRRSRKTRPQ